MNLDVKIMIITQPCTLWLGFFFQNDTDFQTILLVSTFSKLFKKLTYRAQ